MEGLPKAVETEQGRAGAVWEEAERKCLGVILLAAGRGQLLQSAERAK